MYRITVTASHQYDVILGPGLLADIGALLAEAGLAPCKAALITDTVVAELYAPLVSAALTAAGFEVHACVFPAGEESKSLATLGVVLESLAAAGLVRSDLIVALGGGVTGDLAGMAAATYLRGLPLVQLPTTLLAMVDSSVGGKNGVNLAAGKNMAGCFYQPRLVAGDTEVLTSLSAAHWAEGMAEAIKCGMIADRALLARITRHTRGGDAAELAAIIADGVRIKAELVGRDEFDRGARHLLNFGHTPAHAIERRSNFSITHGQAVAMGMVIITRAAIARGLAAPECWPPLRAALDAQGLKAECPYDAEELAVIARRDKKRQGDTLRLVIPETPGQCRIHPIAADDIAVWLAAGLEADAWK